LTNFIDIARKKRMLQSNRMISNLKLYDHISDEDENSRFEAELPSLHTSAENPQKDFHQKIDEFLELNIPEGKNII
jgi:hypothetical protein